MLHRERVKYPVAGKPGAQARVALLCASLMLSSSGCLMAGARVMGSSWAPVQVQAVAGVHLPIPVGDDMIISVEGFAGGASSGTDESLLLEASVGAAYLLGDSTPYWKLEGGVMRYAGAGLSVIDATLTRDGSSDSGRAYAPFVYGGAWIHQNLQALGFEARYTFGWEVDLHGERELVRNVQLMVVFLVDL